ncbi:MAG: hypothetical protein Q8K65_10440 [Alphaproteobacteria bacterium]|nr:hypothetical protein [Alphaproteobacteria bacterium]
MTGTGAWQDVLEGDSIDRFLGHFVLSDRQRGKILRDYPNADLSHLPVSKNDVMQDIEALWQSRGFLTPAETQAALIEKYMPGADARLHDFIRDTELSRNKPETVTGYLTKEHAYLATSLAHLYAQQTGMPMTMIEVDFSNMGGTNDYFRQTLGAEAGVLPVDIPQRQAEELTDRAVRLLSAGMTADIAKLYPEEKIVPIRTGGDELRILVTGITDPSEQLRLSDLLHANIERRVAKMGLQDHPHLKAPEDPRRNGFGAALAVQDMALISNPGTLIQELDARITETKNQLGMMRLGMIDSDAVAAETEGRLRFGMMRVPHGISPEDVIDFAIDRAQRNAQVAADALRDMNPAYNRDLAQGIAGFNLYVDKVMPLLIQPPVATAFLPKPLDKESLGGQSRPEGVDPSDSLERRYVAVALEHFYEEGIALSPTALHFLKLSVRGLSPEDPSAQVMMPVGMVRMLDNTAADAADFRAQVNTDDPDIAAALQKAGLKDAAQIMPQALAVSMHNLAGLNSALGHHNADIVLRYIAHEVIGGAVHAAGVPRQARASFTTAHHGGGNFSVLLPAGGADAQGQAWFASQRMIHDVRSEIKSRIKTLNETGIAAFLEKNGGYVDDSVRLYLGEKELNTFANIRDPKERSFPFGEEIISGRVNGIHAVVVGAAVAYDPSMPGAGGGAFIGALRTRADAMMEQLRGAILHQAHRAGAKTEDGMPPRPFQAAFNSYALGSAQAHGAFIIGGVEAAKYIPAAENRSTAKPKAPGDTP